MEGAAAFTAASDAAQAVPASSSPSSSASPPTATASTPPTATTSTNDPSGPIPLYAPKPNRCSFFLKRKGRFCTVPRLPNSVWCGNHQHLASGYDDDGAIPARSKTQEKRGGQRRLPCPLDPKHTVYERELKAHIRVCNVQKETQGLEDKPYYRLGTNSGGATHTSTAAAPARTLTMEEVRALFVKVQHLASDKRPHPRGDTIEQLSTGPVATKILASIESNNVTSEAKARHVIQQASLVSHLDRRGLLHDQSTCVEMGAGRGTLGQAVHLAFPQARVVLVERSGVKFKADAPFRRTGEGSYFERYRLDIRDLWLKGLPLASQVVVEPSSSSSSSSPSSSSAAAAAQSPPLVFMGKHVCGVATDLSLRAVAKFLQANEVTNEGGATTTLPTETAAAAAAESAENGTSKNDKEAGGAAAVKVGVVIATCCYHVCKYDEYVGVETWENELNLTRAEFVVAQRSACWVSSLTSSRGHRHKSRVRKAAAAAAPGTEKEEEEQEEEVEVQAEGEEEEEEGGEEEEEEEEEGEDDFVSHGKGLSREEKIKVGWACKRLIDYGRLQFLRKYGLEAECVVYCDPDVSPENSCILAWSKERGVEKE